MRLCSCIRSSGITYSASNAYLDGLSLWRRQEGLPCSSLQFLGDLSGACHNMLRWGRNKCGECAKPSKYNRCKHMPNISVQLLNSNFLDPLQQYLKPIDFSWCFPLLNISNPRIVEVPRVPQNLTVMMLNIVCDVHSFWLQEGLRVCIYSCAYIYIYWRLHIYTYHITVHIYTVYAYHIYMYTPLYIPTQSYTHL